MLVQLHKVKAFPFFPSSQLAHNYMHFHHLRRPIGFHRRAFPYTHRVPPRRAIAALLLSPLLAAAPLHAQDVSAREVRHAVQSAVRYLKQIRQGDGHWPYSDEQFQSGADALAVLALLQAAVPPDDPSIAPTIAALADDRDRWTYTISLKIAVLAAADPVRHRPHISRAAQSLARMQLPNGMWSYGSMDPRGALGQGDNSNTQFALFGLHEAARAGEKINPDVWRRAAKHWQAAQQRDGGWGYSAGEMASRGSMTAAGVASLIICGEDVARGLERGYQNGVAERCGLYATSEHLARGINWLADNFDPRVNPRYGSRHFYWLYAVERAGMLTGLKFFGRHDWYREGAAYLVRTQRGDGSWNGDLVDTAFALLFLAKGRRPVLISKLAWTNDARANPDRHDVANLTAFLGDRLGTPVTWQMTPLDAPLEEWLETPILYFQGHDFPKFTAKQRAALRRYVEAGGTLLAEACCSRQRFVAGFEAFAKDTFPEYPLGDLAADHAVWSAMFPMQPGDFRLRGIDIGCRTSIFLAPTDLSCLWEQADVPRLSRQALQLGANIAAYATGRAPLRDRLDTIALPDPPADRPADHGVLQIAQLMYDGDWHPDAHVAARLAEFLHDSASVDVSTRFVGLRPDDAALREHPIVYLSGHTTIEFSAARRDALRRHLSRGGFLFIDACCGRRAFDRSARKLAAELFPDAALKPLPADHAIYAGKPGFDVRRVRYREYVRRENPSLDTPRLEGMTVDQRLVIVYSPYSLGCGIEGHPCFACRGLESEDARKVAANVILYALSH